MKCSIKISRADLKNKNYNSVKKKKNILFKNGRKNENLVALLTKIAYN